jgi:non-reducing end alpha-L-arabinofuranosidase
MGGVPATGGSGASGGYSTAGGTTSSGGSSETGGSPDAGGATTVEGPCDIYAAADTPYVAAHSMVRALHGTYSGNLYQVRASDNTTKGIPVLAPGGFADT